MNKPFLLIAGYNYYPESGTNDWIGRFETHEEASSQIETIEIEVPLTYIKGKNKGKTKCITKQLKLKNLERNIDFIYSLVFKDHEKKKAKIETTNIN